MEIKHGATRQVFLIGKYAIKMPSLYSFKHFLQGWSNNITEIEFHSLRKNSNQWNYLCPILFSFFFGFFVVMPRCTKVTSEELFSRSDIREEWIGEINVDNVGWYKDELYLFDYGDYYCTDKRTDLIKKIHIMTNEEAEKIAMAHVNQMMEHFDSVQIIATFHDKQRDVVKLIPFGAGCIYSRLGATKEWVINQDEMAKQEVRKSTKKPRLIKYR